MAAHADLCKALKIASPGLAQKVVRTLRASF